MRLSEHRAGDKTVWTYQADSLSDWLNTAQAYDPSQSWHSEDPAPADEQSGHRTNFTGTESLADAVTLARSGWTEGVKRMERSLAALSANVTMPDVTPSYSYDVGGMFPDVAAYCAGEIEHMVTPEPVDSQTQTVAHLVIVGTYPAMMRTAQVEVYGAGLLSVVDALQRSGRSVSLDWCESGTPSAAHKHAKHGMKKPDMVLIKTPVMEEGRSLDIASVSFAFHPSMLRRLDFAVSEMRPELEVLGDNFGGATKSIPDYCQEPGKIYPPGPWQAQSDGALESVDKCAQYLHDRVAKFV